MATTKTEIKMSLKEKLLKVQSELKAPKSKINNYSPSKFHYRSAEDILEAVKPLLVEARLLQTISDEVVLIGDRFYIKATVTIVDVETEESISVSALAREVETKKSFDESQITGSASSYARKYAMNGMYCIDDGNDADGDDNTEAGQTKQKTAPKPQTKPQAKPQAKKDPDPDPDDDRPTLKTVLYEADQKGISKDDVVEVWKKQFGDKANTKDAKQIQKMLEIVDMVEEWGVMPE